MSVDELSLSPFSDSGNGPAGPPISRAKQLGSVIGPSHSGCACTRISIRITVRDWCAPHFAAAPPRPGAGGACAAGQRPSPTVLAPPACCTNWCMFAFGRNCECTPLCPPQPARSQQPASSERIIQKVSSARVRPPRPPRRAHRWGDWGAGMHPPAQNAPVSQFYPEPNLSPSTCTPWADGWGTGVTSRGKSVALRT